MATVDLTTKAARRALPSRPNVPYWQKLEKGRALGYRKVDDTTAYWLARRSRDDSSASTGSARYQQEPLGAETSAFDFTAAKHAAETWFSGRDAGVSDDVPTVETICREYVEDRRTEKGDKTAYDAEVRFKRRVYDTEFGATRCQRGKLITSKLKAWRAAIPGTNSAKDREWRSLKAALNCGVLHRRVDPALAIEWRSVPPLVKADGRRDLFLDLAQRRKLIKAATGITRATLELVALTGCRPGEAVALVVGDVDVKLGTVRFRGKTGERSVPLAPRALRFLRKLCKGKAATERILPWNHSGEWSREIRAAAKRADLPPGVCAYTMRHGFITTLLREGVAVLDVSRLTGTSLAMIQKHYGQFVKDAAAERIKAVKLL